MFGKILIANRGAIAVRIARTCERLGISTVAIHSDIEAESLHVQTCDEAVRVGGAPIAESYLNIDAILAAAQQCGAEAIHPGYGLLSENPDFARQVQDAGLTFIGPSPDSMALFQDKLQSRALATQAGVRVASGSEEPLLDVEAAVVDAQALGYPLILKAVCGSGGLGLQRIPDEDTLRKVFPICQSHARLVFGDERLFLEELIDQPRHLEVQVLGDTQGDCVALGERESSLQRRYQKVIEESPSPVFSAMHMGELKRTILCDAALRVAKEAHYHSTGTAEFLMDAQGRFYFIEFNPMLQVEHAVTELCTGLDLVELQLLIAKGSPLPPEAVHAQTKGHAMEARIYAEDPSQDFLPQQGTIDALRFPIVAPGSLRVESGVSPGEEITPYYDALLAKVITFSPTRHQALLTLDRVLAETVIRPLNTNIDFLRQLLADEAFRAGQFDTETVERVLKEVQDGGITEAQRIS